MNHRRRFPSEALLAAGTVLLGRFTYQIFAACWPTVTDEEDEVEWYGTTVIKGDVVEEVASLREQPGKDMLVVASSGLVQSLILHDLVDGHQLWVHPVVPGSGKRPFREGDPCPP